MTTENNNTNIHDSRNERPLHSAHHLWQPFSHFLISRRGRSFGIVLIATILLALLLPLVNILFIYPAFTQVLVTGVEKDVSQLGKYLLPPELKNNELKQGLLSNRFFGEIYKLEQSFGQMTIKVFSSDGEVLYSNEPTDLGHLNTQPYFKDVVAKGKTYSKLITKTFKISDEKTETFDIVEIYVPFMKGDTFLGAFEMYYDITHRKHQLDGLILYSTLALLVMAIGLITSLLFLLKKETAHMQAMERAEELKADMDRITQHDLKSPLISILSGITYLSQFTPLTDEQAVITSDIRTTASTAMDRINRSLEFYKMETGTFQYVPDNIDLLSVTQRVVTDLVHYASLHDVKVILLLGGTMPTAGETMPIEADETLCYSIMANLLKNGIEASSPGDRIAITLSENGTTRITIHTPSVVPEEIRETFFDKDTTAGKATGTGLGTYSARLMAQTMGGTITMKTSEENGTLVTVALPKQHTR